MKYVDIPDSVTVIDNNAFSDCGLESMKLPSKLYDLGKQAFMNNMIKSIIIPGTVTIWGDYAFGNNAIETVVIEEGVKTVGTDFRNSSQFGSNMFNKVSSLILPSTVESIGFSTFAESGLLYYDLPAAVKELGMYCFISQNVTMDYLAGQDSSTVKLPEKMTISKFNVSTNGVTINSNSYELSIPTGVTSVSYSHELGTFKGDKRFLTGTLTLGKNLGPTPTPVPTPVPTSTPTVKPTAKPTAKPTVSPSASPAVSPSVEPTTTPKPTVKPGDKNDFLENVEEGVKVETVNKDKVFEADSEVIVVDNTPNKKEEISKELDKIVSILDVYIKEDGFIVDKELDSKIRIFLDGEDYKDYSDLKVWQKNKAGEYDELTYEIEDGMIVFECDALDTYVLTGTLISKGFPCLWWLLLVIILAISGTSYYIYKKRSNKEA